MEKLFVMFQLSEEGVDVERFPFGVYTSVDVALNSAMDKYKAFKDLYPASEESIHKYVADNYGEIQINYTDSVSGILVKNTFIVVPYDVNTSFDQIDLGSEEFFVQARDMVENF
jgi:hypothetical protein